MASRAQLLSDPRSGVKAGAGSGRKRAAPDQGTRDELARARGRRPTVSDQTDEIDRQNADTRARTRARRRPAGRDASPGSARDGSTATLPAVEDQADGDEDQAADDEQAPAPREAPKFTTQGAGALLALFAYPLLVNFLTGGPGQMWGWVKAKWVNQPYGGASSAGGPGSGGAIIAPAPQTTSTATAPKPRTKYGGK